MQLIYQAKNSVEAHLILNLLEQAGLTARIDGEYLQGGMGELQVFGNVRVLIAEADYEQGKEIIRQWESEEPIDINRDTPTKTSKNKQKNSYLTIEWEKFTLVTIIFITTSLMLYDNSASLIVTNCFSWTKPFHENKTYKTTIIPVIEEVHNLLSFELSNNKNNVKNTNLNQAGLIDGEEFVINFVKNEELDKVNTQNLYKSLTEKLKNPTN